MAPRKNGARDAAASQADGAEQADGGAAGPGPSSEELAAAGATRRFSLLPRKWQRFQHQLEGRPFELPRSGANVTANDLIKCDAEEKQRCERILGVCCA